MISGYIGIGAFIGFLSNLLLKERGLKMLPSIGVAMLGALIGGIITYSFELKGSGFYALISSIVTLFIFNVFRTKEDPIFDVE
tara:strand:- start:3298 stop:3546 length:249 start_codon:yes stop_codon:yes gene_type:complete